MEDQTRNLNPTKEGRIAQILWNKRYVDQRGGVMDFFDSLSIAEKKQCRRIAEELDNLPFGNPKEYLN